MGYEVKPQSETEAIADIKARGGADAKIIFEIHKLLGDDWQAAYNRTVAWLERVKGQ
uniref:Uncharacterized protein n=1 Tax=viral metagenome TaxID=1070528 RepID=A0A6H1ZWV3_9ZZZZ